MHYVVPNIYGMEQCQIAKLAECVGDLSCVKIACAAVFVSLNNSSIVAFCCYTKISRLEQRLKFKVHGREIGHARQTSQSGSSVENNGKMVHLLSLLQFKNSNWLGVYKPLMYQSELFTLFCELLLRATQ